jgi:2-keto-3-deoxy-L-fuconate dehydrogenase
VETRSFALSADQQENSEFRLDGKVAVVTGGASGIGRAIAERFAKSGASVRILDLNETQAGEVARGIVAGGGNARSIVCDVTDQRRVRRAFNELASEGPLKILVNNAGISHVGSLEGTSEADFEKIFQVNVKGMYNCMLACVEHMKATGGVILNMASIAGSTGLADRFAYSMSKGAVIAMTYSVARDYLSYNIRCNCISPARVHTPFVDGYLHKNYPGRENEFFEKLSKAQPIGRMGQPGEVADLTLFLCSDHASFITGVNYPMDGGFLNLHG